MLDKAFNLSCVLDALALENTALDTAQSVANVSTDSRDITAGDLFVALRGEKFDGHDFVQQCLEQGACAAVVDKDFALQAGEEFQAKLLVVDDTALAYGLIAKAYRALFDVPVVALTGSAGKTTSKEMLAAILSQLGSVCSTQANFNNEIGVPKTLLQLRSEHDFAVVEMGAAKTADIAYLMQFADAEVGLLTNVQAAHMQGFGSLDNVAKTKAEIFTCLGDDKTAVINLDDNYADYWLQLAGGKKVLSFSLRDQSADVFADNIELSPSGIAFELVYRQQKQSVNIACLGRFNVANALGASAAAIALGASLEQIACGLEQFKTVAGRMQPIALAAPELCGTILNDSYNANPGAVKAAISTLAGFSGEKVVVLGTMAELGKDSELLHRQVAQFAQQQPIQQVYLLGEQWPVCDHGSGEKIKINQYDNKKDLLADLLSNWQAQQSVLIKGSRSMTMETLVQDLVALAEKQQETC